MKSQMQINKSLQKMVSKKHLTVSKVLVKCFSESDLGDHLCTSNVEMSMLVHFFSNNTSSTFPSNRGRY